MTRHSIHIGIDNYEDNAITGLRFCTADIRVMAHANAICQDNGMQCPQIVMSCSGRPVKLW